MVTVKPETDEEFVRLRAWRCAQWRRSLGLPLRREHIAPLVIRGGKGMLALSVGGTAA